MQMHLLYYLILHYIDDVAYSNKFINKRCKIDDVFNSDENFYYVVNYGGNQLTELFVDDRDMDNIVLKDPFDDNLKELFRSQKNLFLVFLFS